MKKNILTGLLLSVCAFTSLAQTSKAYDILTMARRTNNYFMEKFADPNAIYHANKKTYETNLWTRAVYYEGLMALYEVDPQQRYADYVDLWGNHHNWLPRKGKDNMNADNQCCQQVYIDRFLQSGNRECIANVGNNLDGQMKTGKNDFWTWIDAIQMAMPVYAKYAKMTGQRKYLDYAMSSYKWTRDTLAGGLFNKKEGLWWRDKDYVPPYKEQDGNNCYWSRGNGWVYAAIIRVMQTLPKNSKEYKYLKKDFLAMTKALVKCQRKDGFWNVSLVSPVTFGGPEMTGTSLFLYGMAWGVNNGILSQKKYSATMEKAWKAIASCIHPNGFIGYNQGTGKDPSAGQPVTFNSMPDFEDYGTGCLLLAAAEYYKLAKGLE